MKKEYFLVLAIGLFILSYVLDALVNPLSFTLPTPYHYFAKEILTTYAFTTTTILMKTIGVVICVLLVFSSIGIHPYAKSGSLFIISGLVQLYALQDVVAGSNTIPVEWAVSLTLSGMVLLLPTIFYVMKGITYGPPEESYIVREEDQKKYMDDLKS